MDEIRQVLSKTSSPWVLLALKQDALVKRQLDDQAFRNMAIERIGSDASGWTPAALAFLALKLEQTPQELRDALRQKPDSLPIPEELRQRANAVLKNLCQSPVQVDLAQAGLLALAIYDRYSQLGDWSKVFAELVKECPAVRKSPLGLAAYACLYGFVPDTLALIRGMLLGESTDRSDFISRCEAAIYAVLTQPFTLQEQVDVFQSILKDLTAGARLQFLRALNNRRTSLAVALAAFILSAFPESIVKAVDAHGLDSVGRENLFSDPLGDLERINYSIEIYRIANQPEATEHLLKLAQEIAQNLQSNLVTQLAYTATRKDDAKSALESLERNKPQSASDPRLQAMLALNLMDNHHYADAASILKKQPVEPCAEWLLAKARYLRYKNEIEPASHTALQALEAFAQRSPAVVVDNSGKTESNAQIAAYIRQLADLLLNLPDPKGVYLTQVQRAAELSLIYQPEDPKGLCLLAQTLRLAGYTAKAVETASLAAVLAVNDVDVQRVLAQTFESAGEWESALEVWKGIIYTESPPATSNDSPLPLKNNNPSDLRAYAICAMNMKQPALVLQPLQQVLEMNDQDGQAHIMLANACFSLAKSADLADGYLQAVEHYRQAIRLEPANRLLFRSLSESCAAAGMAENALDAARQALSLAPAEVENILWFARQAMALHAPQETIDTLNWAMKLHSQEVRLKAVLAQANRMLGNEQEALVAYEAVLDSPNDITLDDLLDTGRGLLAFGKTDKAIFALERARQTFPTMGEQASFDLLALLTEAYQTSGNILEGIQAAEGALSLKPQNASLWKRKADMYLQSDQARPALISLERAIELDPQDYEAHRQAMEILRLSGNLAGALEHARKMADESTAARAMAAAFVNEMLEPDLAFEMCQGWEQAAQSDPAAGAQLGCLKAELELASGKDEEAAQTAAALDQIAAALTQDKTDPAWTMCLTSLKTRLAHRGKNGTSAASSGAVEASLPSVADPLPTRAAQSLAEAALELGEWDKALVWSQQVVADMPIEPLPYLNLARAYILRAENQRICRVLAVKQHAPGEIALAEESHQAFSSAIKNAAQRASESQRQRFIQRWEVRGAAVFEEVPSPETLNILANLISDAGDAAACTAAFSRLGDVSASTQAVQAYAGHSLVLLQNALAFLPAQPRLAMETALLAIERWKEAAQPVKDFSFPLTYALAGLSARQAGESETAIHTLQQALALWQDEAEWHQWLAELYAAKADWLPVIEHLEKTIALAEESSASLALAQAYLNANLQPERAVGLLSSILEKNPSDCEAQAFLAEALMQAGQSEQALATFRKVFESPLAEDPGWRVRLALGMAQAALQTGQTAAAVSVLQDVAINVPADGRLFRSLSESYAAAGLVSGAMDAARRAFELAPQDLNTLLWFSEQAMKLQRPTEAAEALVKAVKKNPQAMSLYIRLAKAHMLAGNRQDALATLKYVRVAPGVQFADLLETALCLLDMDEPAAALVCLERARAEIPVLTNEESLSLLNSLVKAFLAKGDPQSGLAEAEKALERMPESAAQINKLKADLYLQSGNPQQAMACIELVLSAQPEDGGAHRQAMEILRTSGDLPGALEHARKVAGKSTAGRLAAAEFSHTMLEDDLAYDLAADVGDSPDANLIETLKLKCLKAELDLNKGNQEAA
ncbi:MAG: tetratricopeptide repeat protein, partial [Chloroflexota bacterium]